ncbi:MAG: sodium:proton antiporter [Lachnospiraceae bacterium]|nr:sodium:proton antiporter [Lachnospiraceae bacterium]
MVIDSVYKIIYISLIIALAIALFACLIRAIKGPRIADRIVAVNMMGTMVMVIMTAMSLMLKEDYLVDISLIYAMISFIAVVVITKVYIGIYEQRRAAKKRKEGEE